MKKNFKIFRQLIIMIGTGCVAYWIWDKVEALSSINMNILDIVNEITENKFVKIVLAILSFFMPIISNPIQLIEKIPEWRNRKAIKEVLINEISRCSLFCKTKIMMGYIVKLGLLIVYAQLLKNTKDIILLLDKLRRLNPNLNFMVPILLLVMCMGVSQLIYKVENENPLNVKWILLPAMGGTIYISLIMYVESVSSNIEYRSRFWLLGGGLVILIASLESVNIYLWWQTQYKYLFIRICVIMRYIALYKAGYVLFALKENALQINIAVVLGWIALSWLEYLILLKKNKEDQVILSVHSMKHECCCIRGKVIQYLDGKIKYTLLDGSKQIVEGRNIQYISYSTKVDILDMVWLQRRKRGNIECITKGDVKSYYFQYYQYISDEWIFFCKIFGQTENGVILHSNDIEQIIIGEPQNLIE